jgi:hypothetical protein
MPERRSFMHFVERAFNARPFGMVVPPNWVGLGAVALLGILNPGFWILGAGLELGYLLLLSTNRRFQRLVVAGEESGAQGQWRDRLASALASLTDADRRRYAAIEARCRSILELQSAGEAGPAAGLEAQQEGLGRLTWMYLRLLVARRTIAKVLGEAGEDLSHTIATLERRLKDEALTGELRRSLEGQREILAQRVERRGDADRQLAFIDAELQRIEHQVELIREQAALSTDPAHLSQRIDEIAATLGGTSEWIRDQRQVLGAMEDLLADPPPLAATAPVKERQ